MRFVVHCVHVGLGSTCAKWQQSCMEVWRCPIDLSTIWYYVIGSTVKPLQTEHSGQRSNAITCDNMSRFPLPCVHVKVSTLTCTCQGFNSHGYMSRFPLPWVHVKVSAPMSTCQGFHSHGYMSRFPLPWVHVKVSTPMVTCQGFHSHGYMSRFPLLCLLKCQVII